MGRGLAAAARDGTQRVIAPLWREEPNREALASALAARVSQALEDRLARSARASLAVSGGTTPDLFFTRLSERALPWERVDVTLVDERWVAPTSPRSNEALARAKLLQGKAARAAFFPLKTDAATPQAGLAGIEKELANVASPFAAVVLGMGADGHTASFFPGADRLAQAIDPVSTRRVEAIAAPGAGEPRVTLTAPLLLAADLTLLHIEGPAKREALRNAQADGPVEAAPIRLFLRRARRLEIYWTPAGA
jgi:6-phosphogluconolactonase